jgi:hypothetical protein
VKSITLTEVNGYRSHKSDRIVKFRLQCTGLEYLFVAYLATTTVIQTILRRMIVNNELERMWK